MRVIVQVCNSAVCTQTEPINVILCEESEERRDENIQSVLQNVCISFLFSTHYYATRKLILIFFLKTQDNLEENNLDDALQSLLAVGDSLSECEVSLPKSAPLLFFFVPLHLFFHDIYPFFDIFF